MSGDSGKVWVRAVSGRVCDVQSRFACRPLNRRPQVALLLLSSPSRFTWGVIQARRAKSGTAVLLTSHSMEEADLLADGIAIMSHGRCGGGCWWQLLGAGCSFGG